METETTQYEIYGLDLVIPVGDYEENESLIRRVQREALEKAGAPHFVRFSHNLCINLCEGVEPPHIHAEAYGYSDLPRLMVQV